LRTADQHWVGPLLADGATATIGYVQEPYLAGTINVATLFGDFTVFGFSFGEAAYAAQPVLSWQTTVVGDPLYRPFGRKHPDESLGSRFQELHQELRARGSPLIEWSHLQVVNLNLAMGYPVSEMIRYLQEEPTTQKSSVLQEKLASLYFRQGKYVEALKANEKALKLPMTPRQRERVMLAQAELLNTGGKEQASLDRYQEFLKAFPDYPDRLRIYRKMLPLAKSLRLTAVEQQIQRELDRLDPPESRKGKD
jgi:tetratricopeptide (TPR) repeat protein